MTNLAEALRAAATDPSHRMDFYRTLLKSDVFVITPDELQGGVLPAGAALRLLHCTVDGTPTVPMFTSLLALQQWIKEHVHYVDPGQPYGKLFTPGEISSLLDGSIFRPEPYVVEQATSVLIGQPARMPHRLIELARQVFTQHRCVRAAHLVHFHNPQRDAEAHSLIGVDSDGDPSAAFAAVGLSINDLPKEEVNGPVDFIRLHDDDFGASIRTHPAFYQRRDGLLQRVFR